jgi:hypothetical protein
LNPVECAYIFQQEMRDLLDWQMIYYADAVHGFTNEYGNDKLSCLQHGSETLF